MEGRLRMAMNVGHRPLYLPRLGIASRPRSAGGGGERWLARRGTTRLVMPCELWGTFPGFGGSAGALPSVKVRLTDRYLLVDEGRPHGFALPLDAIEAVAPAGAPPDPGAGLRLTIRTGALRAGFYVRPRRSWQLRPVDRVDVLLRALADLGIAISPPQPAPGFVVAWANAASFAREGVAWDGTAVVGDVPWSAATAATVWLTDRALMWSSGSANGLARLPIEAIAAATTFETADRAPTPGVALTYASGDQLAGSVIVVNERSEGYAQGNDAQRAIVHALRSRGVPVHADAGPGQPWRPRPRSVGDAAACPPQLAQVVSVPPDEGRPDDRAEDVVPMAERGVALPAAQQQVAVRIRFEADDPAGFDPVDRGEDGAIACFEAAALAELRRIALADAGDVSGSMGVRRLVGGGYAAALAELGEAVESGRLDADEATHRRARLDALNEAVVRLRALVELQAGGVLTAGEFEAKRTAVLAPLTAPVFARAGASERAA